MLIQDFNSTTKSAKEIEYQSSPSVMAKRFFTVQAITNVESLTITPMDVDKMKERYSSASKAIFKAHITQTATILNLLLIMVSDLNRPKAKT